MQFHRRPQHEWYTQIENCQLFQPDPLKKFQDPNSNPPYTPNTYTTTTTATVRTTTTTNSTIVSTTTSTSTTAETTTVFH